MWVCGRRGLPWPPAGFPCCESQADIPYSLPQPPYATSGHHARLRGRASEPRWRNAWLTSMISLGRGRHQVWVESVRGEPSYWPAQSVRYEPRPHGPALLPIPLAPSNHFGACDSSGRAISEGWRGSTPTTVEASAALPRERTFVYHQPEAIAALISSGEAHTQHSV